MRTFQRSQAASERLEQLVPGGAHTYAKGPDQYPADRPIIIERGRGARVWDVDGNDYVEYGSGMRAVILGHARREVDEAVIDQVHRGLNFVRPAALELAAAEDFLAAVPGLEMVKFAKNGSDVTTAAVRLARAATGRDLVAVCSDQPFFSTDDWFIATTAMDAGIPAATEALTITFPYGDLDATRALFDRYDGRIAALVLELESAGCRPAPGYLAGLLDLAHRRGALVIADEMIAGLRYALGGAQELHGVVPDLATFGKALGNGYAVAALAGSREVMELGGLRRPDADRVFLLSTTHGAEAVGLAAMRATIALHRSEGVSQRLIEIGGQLRAGVEDVVRAAGMSDHVQLAGADCNLVFATLDERGRPSQAYRTLFLRALIDEGVIGPSFVVSSAVTSEDIERTVAAVAVALRVYARALEAGDPSPFLGGRPVKPVFRRRA